MILFSTSNLTSTKPVVSTKTSPCALYVELIKTRVLSHLFRLPCATHSSILSPLPITPNLSESSHPQRYTPLQYPLFFSIYPPTSSAIPLPPSHIYYSCLISLSQPPTFIFYISCAKASTTKKKTSQKNHQKTSTGNNQATDN